MKKKLRHIAIAGNIGVGKTSLAKILSKNYNWKLELESVKKNPYLSDFYEDMEKWSFHLQIYFLNNRFEQNQKILKSKKPVIQDRTIYEDEVIFTKNLYESGFLKKDSYLGVPHIKILFLSLGVCERSLIIIIAASNYMQCIIF